MHGPYSKVDQMAGSGSAAYGRLHECAESRKGGLPHKEQRRLAQHHHHSLRRRAPPHGTALHLVGDRRRNAEHARQHEKLRMRNLPLNGNGLRVEGHVRGTQAVPDQS
jgi:hypothetical protein